MKKCLLAVALGSILSIPAHAEVPKYTTYDKAHKARTQMAKDSIAAGGYQDPLIGQGLLNAPEQASYDQVKAKTKMPYFHSPSKKYKKQWEHLQSFGIPDWMLDAKFGVYTHWGPGNYPAYGGSGNYIWGMYDKRNPRGIYEFHKKRFGGLEKVGYTDIVKMFTAEDYDPALYAQLMVDAGAKFGGLGLVHHDGYLMWDSEHSRWNSMDVGPKRDLFGDFVKEGRERGLKIMGSFHHTRTYNYTHGRINEDSFSDEEKSKIDLFQPENEDFFFPKDKYPAKKFGELWHNKIVEVSDKYQPDFIWFDGVQMHEEHTSEEKALSALTHYFDSSTARGQEVTICNKLPAGDAVTLTAWFNYPENVGMRCYENGRDMPVNNAGYWLWDRSIAYPWGYVDNNKYRQKANYHVDSLIDIVARGGIFLLSLSPTPSGAIPQEQVDIMHGIGDWLKVNGEAIYNTRRWHIPSEDPKDNLTWANYEKFTGVRWAYPKTTAEQIRFTQSKEGILFASVLAKPKKGKVTIRNLKLNSEHYPEKINKITLLGYDGNINFTRNDDALTINFPKDADASHAYSFKVE